MFTDGGQQEHAMMHAMVDGGQLEADSKTTAT